jgi:tRNA U34 2-thiouridine synthase MnmA/TrmU
MPCCEPFTAIAPMSFGLDAGRGCQLLAEQQGPQIEGLIMENVHVLDDILKNDRINI